HRHLIVKTADKLNAAQWDDLTRMFQYLPQLRTLWRCAQEGRRLFAVAASPQTAWRRRAALLREESYHQVPELAEVLAWLDEKRFAKVVAYVYSPAGQR